MLSLNSVLTGPPATMQVPQSGMPVRVPPHSLPCQPEQHQPQTTDRGLMDTPRSEAGSPRGHHSRRVLGLRAEGG